jgi:outer membrane immunogenic protein
MRRLLSSLVAATAVVGFSTVAGADGMPGRGVACCETSNWSGLYGGMSLGWMANDYDWAFNPAIGGAPHQAYSLHSSGGVIGLHAGYQHQFGSFVVGVEAGGTSRSKIAREPGFGVGAAADSLLETRKIFTVGPRLGFVVSNWMVYGTGGYAQGDIRSSGEVRATGVPVQDWEETHSGWFLGGGVEYLISKNVMFGLDYKHLDLGTEHHCFHLNGAVGATCNHTNTNERDIKGTADIVSVRLSLKWGRDDRVVPLK